MIDSTTWAVLGLTLSLIGLLLSFVVWRRRGAASGLRAAAWSLLPAAAGLTGVLRLFAEVADSVGSWAARLVFSPVVWLGVVVAGVSGLLFVASGVLRRRQGDRPAVTGRTAHPAAPARSGAPALDDDIEAILRKHGIS